MSKLKDGAMNCRNSSKSKQHTSTKKDIFNDHKKMIIQKRVKKPREFSKKIIEESKAARVYIKSNKFVTDENARKQERDSRTLYVRFPRSNLPTSIEDILALDESIDQVRLTRQTNNKLAKRPSRIYYCFVQYVTEDLAIKGKTHLSQIKFDDGRLYVDYVGIKSKNFDERQRRKKASKSINPVKLIVSGFSISTTEADIKKVFSKCTNVRLIIKNNSPLALLTFSNPADAKKMFDSFKYNDFEGQKLLVLYARDHLKRSLSPKKVQNRLNNNEVVSDNVSVLKDVNQLHTKRVRKSSESDGHLSEPGVVLKQIENTFGEKQILKKDLDGKSEHDEASKSVDNEADKGEGVETDELVGDDDAAEDEN